MEEKIRNLFKKHDSTQITKKYESTSAIQRNDVGVPCSKTSG